MSIHNYKTMHLVYPIHKAELGNVCSTELILHIICEFVILK